ncbi:MAG: hypothetical protein LBM23_08970 [Propionibacteriaceae bacterium]|jgi:hypothetical protein|nr:hypothetical protein [Propionibacteriaceae bacterium]
MKLRSRIFAGVAALAMAAGSGLVTAPAAQACALTSFGYSCGITAPATPSYTAPAASCGSSCGAINISMPSIGSFALAGCGAMNCANIPSIGGFALAGCTLGCGVIPSIPGYSVDCGYSCGGTTPTPTPATPQATPSQVYSDTATEASPLNSLFKF